MKLTVIVTFQVSSDCSVLVQKVLDRVGYAHEDRRRTELQKVVQQRRVLKYIENRADVKKISIDELAYKFAADANKRQRKLSLLAKR